jgi:CBS domain-containing protein
MPARSRSARTTASKSKKSTGRSTRSRATTTRARSSGRSTGTTATRRRTSTTRRGAASTTALKTRAVSDVMSTDPMTIVESEPLVAAARMMRDDDIGAVIVLGDSDGRVVGMVTDRDIVIRAIAEEREPSQTTVGAVCSPDLVAVEPDDSVDSALALMREHAVRRIPVVEDGNAVGIFSIGDLAERFDERSALADISAAPPNN